MDDHTDAFRRSHARNKEEPRLTSDESQNLEVSAGGTDDGPTPNSKSALYPGQLVLSDGEDHPTPPVTPAVCDSSASPAARHDIHARPPSPTSPAATTATLNSATNLRWASAWRGHLPEIDEGSSTDDERKSERGVAVAAVVAAVEAAATQKESIALQTVVSDHDATLAGTQTQKQLHHPEAAATADSNLVVGTKEELPLSSEMEDFLWSDEDSDYHSKNGNGSGLRAGGNIAEEPLTDNKQLHAGDTKSCDRTNRADGSARNSLASTARGKRKAWNVYGRTSQGGTYDTEHKDERQEGDGHMNPRRDERAAMGIPGSPDPDRTTAENESARANDDDGETNTDDEFKRKNRGLINRFLFSDDGDNSDSIPNVPRDRHREGYKSGSAIGVGSGGGTAAAAFHSGRPGGQPGEFRQGAAARTGARREHDNHGVPPRQHKLQPTDPGDTIGVGNYQGQRGGGKGDSAVGRQQVIYSEIASFLWSSDDEDGSKQPRDVGDAKYGGDEGAECAGDQTAGVAIYQENDVTGSAADGDVHDKGGGSAGGTSNRSIGKDPNATDRSHRRGHDKERVGGGTAGSVLPISTPGAQNGQRDVNRRNTTSFVRNNVCGNAEPRVVPTIIAPIRHGGDNDDVQDRSPSWSPTGVVENVVTSGTDTSPAGDDEERDGLGLWNRSNNLYFNDAPARGRTGGKGVTGRKWKVHRHGYKGEAGSMFEESYTAGGDDSSWEAWLKSDGGEEESDGGDEGQCVVDEAEQGHPGGGSPTPASRKSSSCSPRKTGLSPDVRPWLLKRSPQWEDFRRRRSSLLSLHFGKGSLISSTTDPQLARPGSSLRTHSRKSTTNSRRSLLEKPRHTRRASGGRDRDRSLAINLAPCTEIDSPAAAAGSDPGDDVAEEKSRPQPSSVVPSGSRRQQVQISGNGQEKAQEAGVVAGVAAGAGVLGRHRRPSGTWGLDNSPHNSSFSGFSSISGMNESKSSIDVHNFLEESLGSACDSGDGSRREGVDIGRVGGGGVDDGRNGDVCGGYDLDAQDIRFLSESKKLRDALLAVEDLHFCELPLTKQVELMKCLSIVDFSGGQIVYKEGDLSGAVYFLLDPAADAEWQLDAEEGGMLTTETNEDGDEPQQVLPLVPGKGFFGEEGLVYRREHRRNSTVRVAVDTSLAVLYWPAFHHWRDFRLYLLMKKVNLLAKLPATAQTAVLHALEYADYKPGEVIIKEGEPGDKFYMITHGTVTVTAMTADSHGSVYSSSASSSYNRDDDNDEEDMDDKDLSDEHEFVATLSSPADTPPTAVDDQREWIDGGGGRDSGSSGDSNKNSVLKDAIGMVFLPLTEGQQNKPVRGLPPKEDHHRPATLLTETVASTGARSDRRPGVAAAAAGASAGVSTAAVSPMVVEEEPPKVIDNVVGHADVKTASAAIGAEKWATNRSTLQPELAGWSDREWSCIDCPPTERVLTRLYEGNSFGEMALIYDEPRNASVRATTEVTCMYLHKDVFRKFLCDKAFNSIMEQAVLQTACYREQRQNSSGQQQQQQQQQHVAHEGSQFAVPRHGVGSSSDFSTLRALAAVRGATRSSFRSTGQLTFAGDAKGETSGRVINDYRVCERVGEGSFGVVYKVVHVHTGEVNAMKVITKPRRGGQKRELLERTLRREVSVMQMLRHPNVVTLWEVIDDPRSRKVYMIQDFMERGSLLKEQYEVDPIPECIAISKFIQAARGLQYIHSFGIIHGDMKPSNILEDAEGRVKIADFGACVIVNPEDAGGDGDISSSGTGAESPNDGGRDRDRDRRRQRRKKRGQRVGGTPSFHPPELFGEGGVSRISFASDVWALGISLYQMVVGKLPFFGRTYRALMASIKMEGLTFPSDCQIEPYLVNLLHRMLDKNPNTRLSLEEAMNHEWVTREGVCPPQIEEGQPGVPNMVERAEPHVAGLRSKDTWQRRAVHPTMYHPAEGGGGDGRMREMAVGEGGKTVGRATGGAGESTMRARKSVSVPGSKHHVPTLNSDHARRTGDRGDNKTSSAPSFLASPPPSPKSNRSPSPATPETYHKEEIKQHHEQARKQQLDPTWDGGGTRKEGRGGIEARHYLGQEAGAEAKVEEDEDEEPEVWSDGDDKIASPRILENIVDKGHLFLPPGLALHALTVTLPDEIAASSAVSASARATPVAPPASNSATSNEEDQNSGESDTADAAATRSSSSDVLAGSNQRAGHAPLPVPDNELHEPNATASSVSTIATPPLRRQVEHHPHKGEKQALLRRSPMPLSSLLSSPSLLDSVDQRFPSNTEQSDEEEGTSDGGGHDEGAGRRGADGGGNYRSVCSCPAIGATGASPLFARHELTDRSALERSQQLVRKPDFLMLRANPTLGSNKRVVISSLKAVSSLRASAEGEVGSRRSSVGDRANRAKVSKCDTHGSGLAFKSLGRRIDFPSEKASSTRIGSCARAQAKLLHNNQSSEQESDDSSHNNPRMVHENQQAAAVARAAHSSLPTTRSAFALLSSPRNISTNTNKKNTSTIKFSTTLDSRHRRNGGGGSGGGEPRRNSSSMSVKSSNNGSFAGRSDEDGQEIFTRATTATPVRSKCRESPASAGAEGEAGGAAERSFDLLQSGGNPSKGRVRSGSSGGGVIERRKTLSRSALLTGKEESMGCIDEEEPEELHMGGCSTPSGMSDAKARNNLGSLRIVSDSSTGLADNNSTTSYVGSSGAESSNWGMERWRNGAGPQTRRNDLRSYQLICTHVGIGDAKGGAEGGGGASLTATGENDKESGSGAGEGISENDSSSDGMGESLSVADITECLDFIGNGVAREDPELRDLDHQEILALTAGSGARGSKLFRTASSSGGENILLGHVQARAWAGQVNLGVGVRFGVSLDQGKRCCMEDTMACLTDAFSVVSGSNGASTTNSSPPELRSEDRRPESGSAVGSKTATAMAATGTVPAVALGTAATLAKTAATATTKATSTGPTGTPEAASYFGLFDGHGGADVATLLQDALHLRVLNSPNFPSDIPQAMCDGCLEMDQECLEISDSKRQIGAEVAANSLKKQKKSEQAFSGAVAVMAIVHRPPAPPGTTAGEVLPPPPQPPPLPPPLQEQKPPHVRQCSFSSLSSSSRRSSLNQRQQQLPVFLHVANVGDCRAVLCRGGSAVAITRDHTPSVPSEAARVEAAGGFVSRGRVNGILGVSRSFGDIHCKVYPPREGDGLWDEQQIVSRPEVHSIQLTEADSFLILACDGVWDVLSNQEAVSYVHRRLLTHRDVQRAAVELIDKALITSGDNCSCVVICLNQLPASKKKHHSRKTSLKRSRRTSSQEGSAGSMHMHTESTGSCHGESSHGGSMNSS
ncbi:unnamed protein product, partial [Ectocarpus fasciculatus]